MGKDTGFLEFDKESPPLRPVVKEWVIFRNITLFCLKKICSVRPPAAWIAVYRFVTWAVPWAT